MQSRGRGQYGGIVMRCEPVRKEELAEIAAEREEEQERPDPGGLYFVDEIFGGAVPREYIPAVEDGFRQCCRKGAKYGFPCVDIRATLLDGKSHEVDSSQQAFELCAMEAFR